MAHHQSAADILHMMVVRDYSLASALRRLTVMAAMIMALRAI
jgi:hypothetical protein